jgi:hypothetical protein
MDRIDAYLLQFRTEMTQRFVQLENRLDLLIPTVQSLDNRIPTLTNSVIALQGHLDKLEMRRIEELERLGSVPQVRGPGSL